MSEKKSDGGPAFPAALDTAMMAGLNPSNGALGMTLRDYFAAKALLALIGDNDNYRATGQAARNKGEEVGSFAAESAYEFADAMLAARGAKCPT
jgi:hypothetical protein